MIIINRNSTRVTPLPYLISRRCRGKKSLREGTFFADFPRIPLKKLLIVIYLWGQRELRSKVSSMVGLTKTPLDVCHLPLYLQERSRRQTSHPIRWACVRGQVWRKSIQAQIEGESVHCHLHFKLSNGGFCSKLSNFWATLKGNETMFGHINE